MIINIMTIEVDGVRYEGWKSLKVTKSIETFCGKFSFETTQTDASKPFPVKQRSPCKIYINGELVINGYIEKLEVIHDARGNTGEHTITVSGRDRTCDIVDNTLGTDFQIKNTPISLPALTQQVVDYFNLTNIIKVIPPSFQLRPIANSINFEHAKGALDYLQIYASKLNVLLVTTFDGNIAFVRAPSETYKTVLSTLPTDPPIIKSSTVTYDDSKRFHKYVVSDQGSTGDPSVYIKVNNYDNKKITNISNTQFDKQIRDSRIYNMTSEDATTDDGSPGERAKWEANFRRAQAFIYNVEIVGFKPLNDSGIWSPNKLVQVVDPESDLPGTILLISTIEYSQDTTEGSICNMRCVTKDAFTTIVDRTSKAEVDDSQGNNMIGSGGKGNPSTYLGDIKKELKKIF